MRSFRKSMLALMLCTALIIGLLPVHAASLREVDLPLSKGLEYTRLTDGTSSADAVQTFRLTYTPGEHTLPMVVYGDSVYGTTTPEEVLAEVGAKGYAAAAVVNADFFSMSSGVPEGLLITDGVLRCSDSWQNAVGIRADGSFFLGAPQLKIQLTGGGKTVSITYINKLRTNKGVYLLTSDFDDTDHLRRAGTKVWLKVTDGREITIGGRVAVEVERIEQSADESAIPEGYMLLTVADDGPGEQVKTLEVGDRLTLSVSSADTRWNDAVYACGAGAFLVSDGVAASGLSASKRPVTALGIRADGSVVILAADGRSAGYSAGFSLAEAARHLLAQGCVNAVNLDGGGSTTVYTREPGYRAAALSNVPSDGAVRKCANYLVFINTAAQTGKAEKLWVYPSAAYVLAGAEVDYQVLATDAGYQPAGMMSGVSLQAGNLGTVSGTRFTAGMTAGSGMVTASAAGLSGFTAVTVCTSVDALEIRSGDARVNALTLEPGESIDLDALARVAGQQVISRDDLFEWTVTGGVGTVDANGVFTAGSVKGLEGTVTLRYGGKSIKVDVTVGRAPQLLDGFETVSGWVGDEKLVLSGEADAAFVRYGYGSARVDYTLTPADGETTASARLARTFAFSDNADYLNIWVHGGSGLSLTPIVWAAGEEKALVGAILEDGWQLIRFAVPDDAQRFVGFELSGSGTGSVRLDGMSVSPGVPLGRDSTLELEITQADTGAIAATVRDAAGYLVKGSDIELKVDGRERGFVYDAGSGRLIADEPLMDDGKAHRVTLTAQDAVGNLARVHLDIAAAVQETVFDDMRGHWAEAQANVLHARGIMNGETAGTKLLMNPGRPTTRQEMAAFVARFLGYDLTQYENVELPFDDADRIASWALPYVKAMYAEGLMQGSASGDRLNFNPEKYLTRAEVMAILGRTLPQGYGESSTVYADSASVPAWAASHLGKLVTLGVIGGYPDNTVRPGAPVTRAEVTAMLYRIG